VVSYWYGAITRLGVAGRHWLRIRHASFDLRKSRTGPLCSDFFSLPFTYSQPRLATSANNNLYAKYHVVVNLFVPIAGNLVQFFIRFE